MKGFELIPRPRYLLSTEEQPYETAPRTYNPASPRYSLDLVKNRPGQIYPVNVPTDLTESSRTNPLLAKVRAEGLDDPEHLSEVLRQCAEELEGDPDYRNFRIKHAELESFIRKVNAAQPGEFHPGSVSLQEGLFLYWIVRSQRPKVVVQTGTSNGVSCAFIALALKKNRDEGMLLAVDLPYIYDPDDPFYQQPVVYGVLIPPGKGSGWLVPDGLQHGFDVVNGDAKELLPEVLEKAGKVDMFYHDSDHSYDHLMFELECALPYMNPHGVIVVDDIGWTSATWDFAERIGCYGHNQDGKQGLIFL